MTSMVQPQSIRWAIGNVPSSVDYTPPPIEAAGKTVADLLNELFNPRYGCTWRTRVVGNTVYIDIVRLVAEVSLEVNLADDPFVEGVTITREAEAYDVIVVTAAQPKVGLTLHWTPGQDDCALIPDGWEPGASADAIVDSAPEDQPYDQAAWRTFRMNPLWGGLGYGMTADGLRSGLISDGSRVYSTANPSPLVLDLDRTTVWGEQWTADATGQRQGVVVVAGSSGAFEDISQRCPPTPIGGVPPGGTTSRYAGINLGTTVEDAALLRDLVGIDGSVYVTLTVREWAPLKVWWTAPRDNWPIRDVPRIYHRQVNGLEQWRGAADQVAGVNEDGTLKLTGSEKIIRNDIARLTALLTRLVDWFGSAKSRAKWTSRGTIGATLKPGDVITTLTTATGVSHTVNAPIARVSHVYTPEALSTTYEVVPIRPDIASVA